MWFVAAFSFANSNRHLGTLELPWLWQRPLPRRPSSGSLAWVARRPRFMDTGVWVVETTEGKFSPFPSIDQMNFGSIDWLIDRSIDWLNYCFKVFFLGRLLSRWGFLEFVAVLSGPMQRLAITPVHRGSPVDVWRRNSGRSVTRSTMSTTTPRAMLDAERPFMWTAPYDTTNAHVCRGSSRVRRRLMRTSLGRAAIIKVSSAVSARNTARICTSLSQSCSSPSSLPVCRCRGVLWSSTGT